MVSASPVDTRFEHVAELGPDTREAAKRLTGAYDHLVRLGAEQDASRLLETEEYAKRRDLVALERIALVGNPLQQLSGRYRKLAHRTKGAT